MYETSIILRQCEIPLHNIYFMGPAEENIYFRIPVESLIEEKWPNTYELKVMDTESVFRQRGILIYLEDFAASYRAGNTQIS